MKCEYCEKPMIDCLKRFECSLYELGENFNYCNIAEDETFKNINEAIYWAKKRKKKNNEINFLAIYQGCNRENEVYQQCL